MFFSFYAYLSVREACPDPLGSVEFAANNFFNSPSASILPFRGVVDPLSLIERR